MTNIEHLKETSEKINKLFKDSFLNKIQQLSNHDFLFGFSKGKNFSIIVSINLLNPFIEITDQKFLQNVNSLFFQRLKNKIMNSSFKGCYLLNNDNIICLQLLKTTDTYDKILYKLVIELFKSNTNIILINNDLIVDEFRTRGMDTNRPILNNIKYETPRTIFAPKEFSPSEQEKINEYILNIENLYLKEKYCSLLSLIKRKRKSLIKKIEKLEEEQKEALDHQKYLEYGDYLKMSLNEVKKGDKFFVYNDIKIPLKENLSPSENLQYFYKVYKKSKLTEEASKKYLLETKNEIQYLDNILSTIDFYNETEYLELINELSKSKLIKIQNKPVGKKTISASKPSYVVFNNVKIGFGKNSSQNNELTFKIAKKEDYFLHINKVHGPHIIIFDNEPSDKVITFACELAIFLAKNQDGDVIYTSVSNLRKTNTLGQVKLLKYETYHINKISNDIKKYLLEAKRF